MFTHNFLETWGWDSCFESSLRVILSEPVGGQIADDRLQTGRVTGQARDIYRLIARKGETLARVSGHFRHLAAAPADFPAVGDWVLFELDGYGTARIQHVLPRRTWLSRKTADVLTRQQLIGANLDTVCIVQGLDENFNLARLERYLVAVREGGARAVVLLNKADLCDECAKRQMLARSVAGESPVHVLSATTDAQLDSLNAYLMPGQTVGFVGSSGVGKSTLVNRLLGDGRQNTQAVRAGDSRGRHTTVSRELFLLPGRGLILDTPGMRELGLWDAHGGVRSEFADIEELARECRFADCAHDNEPGCAIQAAIENGALAERRWRSYAKLTRELEYLDARQDERSRLDRKRKDRERHRQYQAIQNEKKKRQRAFLDE